jgi:acetyl-CoA carboxylase beta subunit
MTTQAAAEPGPDREPVPDPHTTAGKIADLERRRHEAVHAGSEQAVAKQHERGKLTARERIELLLDPGSFTEFDELARHRATDFGIAATRPYGDGVVTGYGTVDGRPVCVFSQDFTVFGGSLGEVYGEKIVKIMDHALKTGCPMIGINDGGGARIQEGVVALGLFAEIFYRNVMASGVIPQISLIVGPCAGGAVYSPAITDFTLMVEGTSHMFITGPDVIKTVTGEDVTFEELGGAQAHGVKSGVAHYQAKDEQDCIDFARDLLSYLPSNNLDEPPRRDAQDLDLNEPDNCGNWDQRDAELDTLIPDSPNQPYDMHEVIAHVLDDGEFLEIHAGFAPNMVVGFGRVEGSSVGVVANQPMHLAGCLGKGGPVRQDLRRVQHPDSDLRRRARIPARREPGMARDHPPRRQAHLRLRRGHSAEGNGDHQEGLRRRLRRDGIQAPGRRRQPGLADRADRGHGRAGRGEHLVPPRAGQRRRPRRAARPADHRVRGHPGQPVHRGRTRLRGRGHPPGGNQARGHPGAARPAHQAADPAAEETRQHTPINAIA